MTTYSIRATRDLFSSRLAMLDHLLGKATDHFGAGDDSYLALKLIDDMLPLGTQVAFACNQPHNFVLWCQGKNPDNLDPEVPTTAMARDLIAGTVEALLETDPPDSRLEEITRLEFGDGRYAELTGITYLQDFLVPNFYFHLVTAYDILRANGVQLGKADYMMHLLPLVKSD